MEQNELTPVDLKNLFLSKLVYDLFMAKWRLYDSTDLRERQQGMRSLLGIIDLLDKDSQEELKKQRDFIAAQLDSRVSNLKEVQKTFSEINIYIQEVYMKDKHGFHFQNPGGGKFKRRH